MIRVSVLIASHRSQFLPRALASVFAQTLASDQIQTLVNYSPDPGLFRTNWNDLASIAKGDYLVILGDDDTLKPEYLETAVTVLDHTGADIAYAQTQGRNGRDELTGLYVPPSVITLETMRHGNAIWQSSVVRRSTWLAVGGYDMSIPYAHDYDFWVRCLQQGARTTYLPMIGWTHYAHDEGRVTTTTDHAANWRIFDAKHPGFRLTAV